MARKRIAGTKRPKLQNEKAVSRREFFKSGAAAGVGAAILSASRHRLKTSPGTMKRM